MTLQTLKVNSRLTKQANEVAIINCVDTRNCVPFRLSVGLSNGYHMGSCCKIPDTPELGPYGASTASRNADLLGARCAVASKALFTSCSRCANAQSALSRLSFCICSKTTPRIGDYTACLNTRLGNAVFFECINVRFLSNSD